MLTRSKVTKGHVMNLAELSEVQGRPWDDVDVSLLPILFSKRSIYEVLTYWLALRSFPSRADICLRLIS